MLCIVSFLHVLEASISDVTSVSGVGDGYCATLIVQSFYRMPAYKTYSCQKIVIQCFSQPYNRVPYICMCYESIYRAVAPLLHSTFPTARWIVICINVFSYVKHVYSRSQLCVFIFHSNPSWSCQTKFSKH